MNKSFTIGWDTDELEKNLDAYVKNKHKNKAYLFPTHVETCMYLLATDMFCEEPDRKAKWEERAKFNSVNDSELLEIVIQQIAGNERIRKIWDIVWERNKKTD